MASTLSPADYRYMNKLGRASTSTTLGVAASAIAEAAMDIHIAKPEERQALVVEFHEGLRNAAFGQNQVDRIMKILRTSIDGWKDS